MRSKRKASELAAEAASPRGASGPLKRPASQRAWDTSGSPATRGLAASAASSRLREGDLRADLAALRFDAIKIRTFRGAIRRVLDPQHGAPAYLDSIRAAAGDFSAAATALSATEMARVGWPSLPAGVLVDEIRDWWDASRQEWSRRIHGFYRVLGPRRDLARPRRLGRRRRAAVRSAGRVSTPGAGGDRAGRGKTARRVGSLGPGGQRHAAAAIAATCWAAAPARPCSPACKPLTRIFRRSMNITARSCAANSTPGATANPRAVRFLQSLDHVAALARPAITVALFFTGLHFAGDLAGQAAAHAAGATAGQLATEAAITGGITGGGEVLVSTTSEGVRQAAGRLFLRLQSRYTQQRARWLAEWLERELLGDLLADLRRGAEVPKGKEFQEVESARRRAGGD